MARPKRYGRRNAVAKTIRWQRELWEMDSPRHLGRRLERKEEEEIKRGRRPRRSLNTHPPMPPSRLHLHRSSRGPSYAVVRSFPSSCIYVSPGDPPTLRAQGNLRSRVSPVSGGGTYADYGAWAFGHVSVKGPIRSGPSRRPGGDVSPLAGSSCQVQRPDA